MEYGDAGRSGVFAVSGVAQRPTVSWRFEPDFRIVVAPVLHEDALIVADSGGILYCLNAATGEVRWKQHDADLDDWTPREDAAIAFTPVVAHGMVFCAGDYATAGRVHDLATGAKVRELEHAGSLTVIGDDLLVADTREVRMYTLPGLTERWRQKHPPFTDWLKTGPTLAADGTAYAALGFEAQHTHGGLTAFDPATPDIVFILGGEDAPYCILLPEPDENEHDEDETATDCLLFHQSHPVVAEGLVWMVMTRDHDDDGYHEAGEPWANVEVVGLDPRTGEQHWVYRLDPALESSASGAVAVADGVVYLAAEQGGNPEEEGEFVPRLHAIDIATSELRWQRELAGPPAGSPVLTNGIVYVTTYTGVVIALDTTTGDELWRLETGETILSGYDVDRDSDVVFREDSRPLLPADGVLYLTTSKGITAFG